MFEFTSQNFDESIKEGVALVDFWAPWCGPCKMLTPTIEEIAAEMPNVKIGKCNIDEAQDIALRFSVMSIPTIIIFKDGEVKESIVGVVPKNTIVDKINSVL